MPPSPRVDYGIAFDAVRSEAVLFGGYTTLAEIGETWAWNGAGWSQRQPPVAPLPTSQHAMAWDGQRVLLAGGREVPLLGTWSWDGTTWTSRIDAGHLPGRGASLAWDSTRHLALAVGGGDITSPVAGTWEWNGSAWRPLALDGGPGPRTGHAMAYDPVRRRVVLYGGYGPDPSARNLEDTWEFDGTSWAEVTPDGGATPGPAAFAATTFDPLRARVLLFGGGGNGSDALWEWDGQRWTYRVATTRPPARFGGWLTWDARRNVAVLTGGRGMSSLDDVWEWDGAAWRQVTGAPQGIAGPVVFDTNRQAVLFLARRETYAWDGTTFRPLGIGRTPGSDTWVKPAVYDDLRERVVLLWFGETWVLASR